MKKIWIFLSGLSLISFMFSSSFAAQYVAEIQSMQVIKEGKPTIVENQGTSMFNEVFRNIPGAQSNPYETKRPVMVRATYRCFSNEKWSVLDIETTQTNDKWGEWVTDEEKLKNIITTKCNKEQEDLYARAVQLEKEGKKLEAIEIYNKSSDTRPDYWGSYNNRAHIYMASGDYQMAMKDIDKVIELAPHRNNGYYDKACIYSLMGNTPEACKYLNLALEKGYKNWNHIKSDSDFDKIRKSACYIEIMAGK